MNFQQALRLHHLDDDAGEKSFRLGKSTHNQRIESYWRQLRRYMVSFYMDLFKNMMDASLLDIKNPIHIECLRLCFAKIIQEDLDNSRKEWNKHLIRPQKNRDIFGGSPNIVYNFPHKFGGTDCRKPVSLDDIDVLERTYISNYPKLYHPEFRKFIELIDPTFTVPATAEEAYKLFVRLIEKLNKYAE